MATALEMANRFLRKHRRRPVANFAGEEAKSVLGFLDSAVAIVLVDPGYWFFDRRQSVLMTPAHITDANMTVTNGSRALALLKAASAGDNPATGERWRAIVTSDSTWGDTAFPLKDFNDPTSVGTFVGHLEEEWPGSGAVFLGATATLFCPHFLFPLHTGGDSKVRKLLSMKSHQNPELRLEEAGWDRFMDARHPRIHEELAQEPEFVIIGDTHRQTANQITEPADADIIEATGFSIWPSPATPTRLEYTSVYRHEPFIDADSTATTPHLPNVQEEVLNSIVEVAHGLAYYSTYANDPKMGDRIMIAALQHRDRLFKQANPAAKKKRSMTSLDSIRGGAFGTRRVPDTIHSL